MSSKKLSREHQLNSIFSPHLFPLQEIKTSITDLQIVGLKVLLHGSVEDVLVRVGGGQVPRKSCTVQLVYTLVCLSLEEKRFGYTFELETG